MYKSSLDLAGSTVVVADANKAHFHAVAKNGTMYRFKAKSEEECANWVSEIQKAIAAADQKPHKDLANI